MCKIIWLLISILFLSSVSAISWSGSSTSGDPKWDYNQTETGDTRFLNLTGGNAIYNIDISPYNFSADTGFFESLGINLNPGESPTERLSIRGNADFHGGSIYNVTNIISGTGSMQSLHLESQGVMAFILDPYDVNVNQNFNWYVDGEAEANRIMRLSEAGHLNISGGLSVFGASYFNGSLYPMESLTYDIGSGALRLRVGYFQNISADYVDITYDLSVDGNITASNMDITGDMNVAGNLTIIDTVRMNILNVSIIQDPYNLGYLEMRGDPWWLVGVDLQIAENLIVDGNVGIGVSNPVETLEVNSSTSTAIKMWATESFGNVALTIIDMTARFNGVTVDGFGALWEFNLEDNSGTSTLGNLGFLRDGADNEGAFIVQAGTDGAEEFMRIASSGNVGINTANPTHKLNVDGSANFTGDLFVQSVNVTQWFYNMSDGVGDGATSWVSTADYIYNLTASVGIGVAVPAYLLEVANSATALNVSGMLYVNSSNVGIGTSTPKDKFEVYDTGNLARISARSYNNDVASNFPFFRLIHQDSSGNTATGTILGALTAHGTDPSGNSVGAGIYFLADGEWGTGGDHSDSPGGISLRTVPEGSGAASEVMWLDPDGNVGIGITTPTHKLNVNGTFNVSGGNDAYISDDLFVYGDGSILGDLGIGTATVLDADTKLEVYADGADVKAVIHEDAGTHDAILQIKRGAQDWKIGAIDSTSLSILSEGDEKFTILTGGNVGIGTLFPTHKFNLIGSANITQNLTLGNILFGQQTAIVSPEVTISDCGTGASVISTGPMVGVITAGIGAMVNITSCTLTFKTVYNRACTISSSTAPVWTSLQNTTAIIINTDADRDLQSGKIWYQCMGM